MPALRRPNIRRLSKAYFQFYITDLVNPFDFVITATNIDSENQ